MYLPDRLRELREAKKLSQGDLEKRSGLLRCYISRVENGHTVPALETLEKMARALEVPLYQLFYEGDEAVRGVPVPTGSEAADWASRGPGRRLFAKLTRAVARMSPKQRSLVMHMAEKISRNGRRG